MAQSPGRCCAKRTGPRFGLSWHEQFTISPGYAVAYFWDRHHACPTLSRVIGIDPGASGAIALLVNGVLVSVHDMPTVTVERNKSQKRQVCPAGLSMLMQQLNPHKAIVEKVGAMPGQGVSSMFSFGRSVGIIEGVLAARQIPVTFVTPQAWQKLSGAAKGRTGAARGSWSCFRERRICLHGSRTMDALTLS